MLSAQQLVAFAQEQPASLVIPVVVGALLGLHTLLSLATSTKRAKYTYLQPASTLLVLGSTLDVMVYHSDRLYDWISDQCVAFGGHPWLMQIQGSVPAVLISTPELYEDVLKTRFDDFQKEEGAEYFTDLFGKGILASDGDVWYFHRKTASNLFSNQMMKDVMYEVVRESSKTLCDVLKVYEARGDQGTVSFKSVITHFTSDVFGKIGFGVDLHCLENGMNGAKGNEFVDAFATSTRVMYFGSCSPFGSGN